jgi:sugar/nucleoside kinase (ribokinase family)
MTISKLALIGNSYLDIILRKHNPDFPGKNQISDLEIRLGGIGNVSRMLCNLRQEHTLQLNYGYPISKDSVTTLLNNSNENSNWKLFCSVNLKELNGPMPVAVIISETSDSSRTSFVDYGNSDSVELEVEKALEFIHISYLDKMPIIDFQQLRKSGCVFLSADLCDNDPNQIMQTRIKDLALNLNVLICSMDEFSVYYHEIDLTNMQTKYDSKLLPEFTIVHSPSDLRILNKGKVSFYDGRFYSGVDTLAAGDYFVAFFLSEVLKGTSVSKSAQIAFQLSQERLANV